MFTLLFFFSADEIPPKQFLSSRSAVVGAAVTPHVSKEAPIVHVSVECRLERLEALEPEISIFKLFRHTSSPVKRPSASLANHHDIIGWK